MPTRADIFQLVIYKRNKTQGKGQVSDKGWTFWTLDKVTGIFDSPGAGAFVTGLAWAFISAILSLNLCWRYFSSLE